MPGQFGAYPQLCKLPHTDTLAARLYSDIQYVPKLSWHNYVTKTIQIIQMLPESVIFSPGETFETCHLVN